MSVFETIAPSEMGGDVFSRIGKQWMLVSAGDAQKSNMLTASWGGLGVLWNKPVSTMYIRPSRYTLTFLEEQPYYALSFLPESERAALTYCGRHSGRDVDKCRETGLTVCHDEAAPFIEQAELVMICRKLYTQDLDPARFLDAAIEENYHGTDYHRMYIGEIVKVLKKA